MVVLVIAARAVLVDEDLDAIVIPVLHERIAVAVEQDIVDDFDQDVDALLRPCDLEAPAEIVRRILGPEPAMVDVMPVGGFPDRIVRNTIDDHRFDGAGREIPVAVFQVSRAGSESGGAGGKQAGAGKQR